MEQTISLMPKKSVLNIHTLKSVLKISFNNKVFDRKNLMNRFQQRKLGFNNISVKFQFWENLPSTFGNAPFLGCHPTHKIGCDLDLCPIFYYVNMTWKRMDEKQL